MWQSGMAADSAIRASDAVGVSVASVPPGSVPQPQDQPVQGELLLSRELRDVGQLHAARAALVGTYAASAVQVFISLKLVRPEGSVVLAAQDYALAMDANVRALLRG